MIVRKLFLLLYPYFNQKICYNKLNSAFTFLYSFSSKQFIFFIYKDKNYTKIKNKYSRRKKFKIKNRVLPEHYIKISKRFILLLSLKHVRNFVINVKHNDYQCQQFQTYLTLDCCNQLRHDLLSVMVATYLK